MPTKKCKRIDVMKSNAVIDAVGGNAAVMDACGVTSQAVSHWRRAGIPVMRFAQIFVRFKKNHAVKAAASELRG